MAFDLIALGAEEVADITSKRPPGWDRWAKGGWRPNNVEFGINLYFGSKCDLTVNLPHNVSSLRFYTAFKFISDFGTQSPIVFNTKEVAGITTNPWSGIDG